MISRSGLRQGLSPGIAPRVGSDFQGLGCSPGSCRVFVICVEPSSGWGTSLPGPGKEGSRETPEHQAGPAWPTCFGTWLLLLPGPRGLQVCSMETVSNRPTSQPDRLTRCWRPALWHHAAYSGLSDLWVPREGGAR